MFFIFIARRTCWLRLGVRGGITPVGTLPDYTLPDRTDTVRKLNELRSCSIDQNSNRSKSGSKLDLASSDATGQAPRGSGRESDPA
jgi:hypothetical protein